MVATMFSCGKSENPVRSETQAAVTQSALTKAYGVKTPKIAVYVETNDVNPLNAGDYCMSDTSFVDIVELFAANIHADSNGDPCLFLNLGNTYNSNTVRTRAASAKNGGYGTIMCFNLRPRSDVDPLPVFKAIGRGAYSADVSMCTDVEDGVTAGDRSRDAGEVSTGYTITYSNIE